MSSNKEKLRILLSGGGVKGAYQAAVLHKILSSAKFEVDKVYGCSIGALHAPVVVAGKLDGLVDLYKNIKSVNDLVEKRSFLGINVPDWNIFKFGFTVFKSSVFKRFLVDELLAKVITKDEISIVKDKCHVVAYNLTENKESWFTGSSLLDGIKASSALWLVVEPHKYKDKLYLDGGASEIFPFNYILNKHDEEPFTGKYLFIDLDDRRYRTPKSTPSNAIELMINIHDASSNKIKELQQKKLQEKLGDNLIIIRPKYNILENALDINNERILQTIEMGYKDGEEFLNTQDDVDGGINVHQIEYIKKIDINNNE